MKPVSAEVHQHIADWVKKGSVLVYCGRDNDPYQSVMEWCNTKGNKYKTPSEHLFKLLGINSVAGKERYVVGKGAVVYSVKILRNMQCRRVMTRGIKQVKAAYEKDAHGGELIFKNNFYLERGPYDIISVLMKTRIVTLIQLKGQ